MNNLEIAAIVDNTGRLQFQAQGPWAKDDANDHLEQCKGVDHLRGATVVTGEAARKAIENGRI